jgi:flagellar hook-basal body complex protein FliE
MIGGIDSNLLGGAGKIAGGSSSAPKAGATGGSSFADTLKDSLNEVAKLQQDAGKAVEDLAGGKTEDMAGVMTAMEKSDVAFKTLLAIRSKLMDAYEEIKSISI